VISTDAYEAFTEGNGPYDKEVAKRLYESVLAWETTDQEDAYRVLGT
jgi:peptidyl-dipeptidase Dcp